MSCCTGSNFSPAPGAALDPGQRVNFSFGMVLGVDDFRQEHAYLAARDERALRETIGYGVLSGLAVSAGPAPVAADGDQVRVAPGLALLPDGHLVGVATEQCANLSAWRAAEIAKDGAAATRPTVYVMLRYAEVSGTPVPIPGEPCRDESALTADARISDSFALDFSWVAPSLAEDNAVRAVVAWLRGIKVRKVLPSAVPMKQFQLDVEAGLRAAMAASWPASVSPPLAATPALAEPSSLGLPPVELVIPRAAYAAYLNAAFEVWVRRLRAEVMAHHGPVPAAEIGAERGLLLAAVDVLSVAGVPPAAELPRARLLGRPQLLHLRLLQEWLLRDGSQDAPREAHYLLGKGDPALDHAQDLLADFSGHPQAISRVDIVPDTTDGGSGNKAVLRPAVKWPGGAPAAGGPDYYGPAMSQPIPASDGGTGQAAAPAQGQLLVGTPAAGSTPARFVLGNLVGAALPKPVGLSPNILVDVASGAPDIRLDTVQDIAPSASPSFAGLDVNGALSADSLAVSGNAAVQGQMSVAGELVLGAPMSSVLATDDKGGVIAAPGWDGDEAALDADPPPPYAYQPGQKAPVRIEDGGTGLAARPRQLQLLVGVEPQPSLIGSGGAYVLADLVAGENIKLDLSQRRDGESPVPSWQLSIRSAGGGGGPATQVLAAGNSDSLPSLTAVTTGNQVVIDTVQPLHPAAGPQFDSLRLVNPGRSSADAMLGWHKETGELVLTEAALPVAVDVGKWPIRVARSPSDMVVTEQDQVIVILVSGDIAMPDLRGERISDGRVIVLKSVRGVDVVQVLNVAEQPNGVRMQSGNALTLVASRELRMWLVIGRS